VIFAPTVTFRALSNPPEHTLVITSFKRLIAALVFVMPVVALVASPVMAATHTRTRHHHSAIHHASLHKSHSKRITSPTAS
jgi:hypothetical protein